MRKRGSFVLALVLLVSSLYASGGRRPVAAETYLVKLEAEEMTKGGRYAGNVSQPFNGAALYFGYEGNSANDNDELSSTYTFTAAGSYSIAVRGASSDAQPAGVSLYVAGVKQAALTFPGGLPTVQHASFNVAGPGPAQLRLVQETDTGVNDTYIDFLELRYLGTTTLARLEAETMTPGGPYAGPIDSPFNGAALYAGSGPNNNNDFLAASYGFPNVPGRYRLDLRGVSSNAELASVMLYVDGTVAGTFTFTGTASVEALQLDLVEADASTELKLVMESDTGANDLFLDYLDLVYVGHASLGTIEAEAMTLGGPYAGPIASPFAGVALYAGSGPNNDNDQIGTSYSFPFVPGRYQVSVRGASSNDTPAGVSLYVAGQQRGVVAFTGAAPEVQSLVFDLAGVSGATDLRLVEESDTGANDTYIDRLEIFYLGTSSPALLTVEAEQAHIGGPYAGTITSPFPGVALYANGDVISTTYTFPTVPGRYRLEVRGASSNSNPAGVTLLVTGTTQQLSFPNGQPTVISTTFDLRDVAGPVTLELRQTTDTGVNDTLVDWLQLFLVEPLAPLLPTQGAVETGQYRSLLRESGRTEAEIQAKLEAAWNQLFYGTDDVDRGAGNYTNGQRIYYPVGDDMAYMLDIGNNDVRSEGMSYGMMIALQLDKQAEFNRLWKWAKTYMQHTDPDDPWYGYFAWHCRPDGTRIDQGNASDGEIWIVTALFMAAGRWGNGEGIYNYQAEAQTILDAIRSKEATAATTGVYDMFDPATKLVRFVAEPAGDYQMHTWTDPSYQEPAYYELWARWADHDNQFWLDAAAASRTFLQTTAHITTGLVPDYANFDGTPHACCPTGSGNHHYYGWDARRTQMNIAMDYHWWARDTWQVTQTNRLQSFFYEQGVTTHGAEYQLDGTMITPYHESGHVGMNAAAGLAGTSPQVWAFVDHLWEVPIPSGQWRYYDGLLYMLGLLQVSGNFRAYEPPQLVYLPFVAQAGSQ